MRYGACVLQVTCNCTIFCFDVHVREKHVGNIKRQNMCCHFLNPVLIAKGHIRSHFKPYRIDSLFIIERESYQSLCKEQGSNHRNKYLQSTLSKHVS